MTLSTLTDAISISAFSGEPDFFRFVRRSLGTLELQAGAQDEVIVQEDSVSVSDIDEFFLLEDGGLLLQETVTAYDGATVISNNLVLDGTQDGLAFQDSRDAGSDILDESGNPIDLENELVTFNRFVFERIDNPVGINHNAIINEDGGFILSERSGKSGSIQPYSRYPSDLETAHTSLPTGSSLVKAQTNSDVSLVRNVGVTLPAESFGNTANSFGLVRLGERPFGTERVRVETELGTIASKAAQEAHHVALIAVSDVAGNEGDLLMEDADESLPINQISKVQPVNLDGVIANTLLLDGTDTNATDRNEQVRLESDLTAQIVIEDGGTDGAGTDAGSSIVLDGTDSGGSDENTPVGLEDELRSFDAGGVILFEDGLAETDVFVLGQVKLEDGTSSENVSGLLLNEASHVGPTFEDVIRRAILDISENPFNTTESSQTTGILLEQAEQGFFKQEDESTVATTYGDDILLENATTFGVNNKLTLENTRLEVEDATDTVGVIPHQNYLNSDFDNITFSSDIYIDIGMSIPLEDGTDGNGNIVFDGTDDSSTDAGSDILHEDGTRASILIDSAFTV